MSPSLFLVCLFLIAACTELGAVIDKEKGIHDGTTLLELFHHINKRQNIALEPKEIGTCTCNCEIPDLPSDCDESVIIPSIGPPTITLPQVCCNSQLKSRSNKYSRMCTSDCAGAIVEYYRCLASDKGKDDSEIKKEYSYKANYVEKYICGKESGDYCPVKLMRSLTHKSYADAYINMLQYCSIPFNSTDLSSCNNTNCTDALRTFSSAVGCCMEPFLRSDVRSCSGVSVPGACAGVISTTPSSTTESSTTASSTTESSATGIIATPIVAVFLMILALAGVFL